jgi:hypothetical protein
MTNKSETLRRVLCLISLAAYAVILCFGTLLLLGYAFHPLWERPWPVMLSIALRWLPVAIFVWLWRRPIHISRFRRGCAITLGVASICLSYFVICLSADRISDFTHRFFEGTLDLWPCILMLLTVTSRSARVPSTLSNTTTPIA